MHTYDQEPPSHSSPRSRPPSPLSVTAPTADVAPAPPATPPPDGALTQLLARAVRLRTTILQRAPLMDADAYTEGVSDDSDVSLVAIAALLNDYNAVADDDDRRQERLRRLRMLDTAIYHWFGAHPAPDLDALPDAPLLKRVLKQSAEEHAEIVEELRLDSAGGGNEVPIDVTNMTPDEVDDVRALWQSMAQGAGQLRVDASDPAFAKRIWGELAKLLQTPTGREIVGYLDEQQGTADNGVDIVPALPPALQPATESESSYAVSKESLLDAKYSGHQLFADRSVAAGTYTAIAGPEGITAAVLAGEPGVEIGGVSYTFGAGSATFVKVVYDDDAAPSPHKMAGEHQNEALDIGFVGTLGHELGHAMKIRAGALAPNDDSVLLGAFEADENEQALWSKRPEEFININAVENRIRDEHGIPRRKYHKPLGSVTAAHRAAQLLAVYNGARATDAAWIDIPEYVEAAGLVSNEKTQLSVDAEFLRRQARLQALLPFIDARGVTTWKTAQINAEVLRVRALVGDDSLLEHLPSWRKLARLLQANGAQAAQAGGDLRAAKRWFRDFEAAFPAETKKAKQARSRAQRASKKAARKQKAHA